MLKKKRHREQNPNHFEHLTRALCVPLELAAPHRAATDQSSVGQSTKSASAALAECVCVCVRVLVSVLVSVCEIVFSCFARRLLTFFTAQNKLFPLPSPPFQHCQARESIKRERERGRGRERAATCCADLTSPLTSLASRK